MGRIRARSEHSGEPATACPAQGCEIARRRSVRGRGDSFAAPVQNDPGDVDGKTPAMGADARARHPVAAAAGKPGTGPDRRNTRPEMTRGERDQGVPREGGQDLGEPAAHERSIGKGHHAGLPLQRLEPHRIGDAAGLGTSGLVFDREAQPGEGQPDKTGAYR